MKKLLKIILWAILLLSALYMITNAGVKDSISTLNGTLIIPDAEGDYCDGAPECYRLDANGNELWGGKILDTINEIGTMVYDRAEAIAYCEGYYQKRDTVAKRNNNPGNLKAGGTTDWQGHTIYETPTAGWLALYGLLYEHRGQTVWQMSRWYASDKESWFNCVTSQLNKINHEV